MLPTDNHSWPPDFTLHKKKQVRRPLLKATLTRGLEVIVPYRFNVNNIPFLLNEHKDWILKNLNRIYAERLQLEAQPLPQEIYLAGINERWKISYVPTKSLSIRLFTQADFTLVLMGNISDVTICKKVLTRWLKNKAKENLLSKLFYISHQILLPYKDAFIRGQKTRWGSCSSDNVIQLNYKLLFLPPKVLDSILIHELCHTVHLNHSDKFWKLVASFDPDWKLHRALSRKAEATLPLWLKDF